MMEILFAFIAGIISGLIIGKVAMLIWVFIVGDNEN